LVHGNLGFMCALAYYDGYVAIPATSGNARMKLIGIIKFFLVNTMISVITLSMPNAHIGERE